LRFEAASFCDRLASQTAAIFMSHRGMVWNLKAPVAAIAKRKGWV